MQDTPEGNAGENVTENSTGTFDTATPFFKTCAVNVAGVAGEKLPQFPLFRFAINVTSYTGEAVGVAVGVAVAVGVIVGVIVGVGVAPEPTTIETLPVRPSSVLPLIVAVMSLAPVL